MKIKYVKQKELIENYRKSLVKQDKSIGGFIARRNSNMKWEIEFSKPPFYPNCKVELKRGKAREFARLNGVEKFMELVGVHEFTVIM